MSYVKKYDVGQIKLEPCSMGSGVGWPGFLQYTHELPLLSFGDVLHSVNLSLVFNYKRYRIERENDSHPFFITNGYKLNLQKHLVCDEYAIPTEFVDGNGDTVGLTEAYNFVYVLNDESQRILRRTQSCFIMEYPDFSKEKYDGLGRITEAYDKYGNTVSSYLYNANGQLVEIAFPGSKKVRFTYESDRLYSITYAGCEILFTYVDGMLKYVEHYSGVKYTFKLSRMNFLHSDTSISRGSLRETDYIVQATAVENGVTVSYSKELRWINAKQVKIYYIIGANIVDGVLYTFQKDLMYDNSFEIVDVTDYNGVVVRHQLDGSKTMYSYEIKDGQPQFVGEGTNTRFAGNVTFYNTNGTSDNNKVTGVQSLKDGTPMWACDEEGDQWQKDVSGDAEKDGYYVISGWIKSDDSQTTDTTVYVAGGLENTMAFDLDLKPVGQWKYFSIAVKLLPNTMYFNKNGANVSICDVRITFQETGVLEDDDTRYTNVSEYVLIQKEYPYAELPIAKARLGYYQGSEEIVLSTEEGISLVTFSDILRYKLRKKREGLSNEIYYENCFNVASVTTGFALWHDDGRYQSISNFDLGVRVYSKGKKSLTIIRVNENTQDNIVREHYLEGTLIGTEILNNNLEVIRSTVDGVTTEYSRDSHGRITQEVVSGLYKRNIIYTDTLITVNDVDPDNEAIISTTRYHIDSTWGCVYKIEMPDGSVVTDTFDGDMSALLQKSFNQNGTRNNNLGYSQGRLASMVNSGIQYDFEYTSDRGELKSVFNNEQEIEYYAYSRGDDGTTVVSKYLSSTSTSPIETATFDKYGRLKKVDGVLENSYFIDPRLTYLHENQQTRTMDEYNRADDGELYHGSENVDGKDSLLAKTTDLLTGKTTKYGYYDGKLTAALVCNSNNSVLSRETFLYDDIGRLTKDNFNYNLTTNDPITGSHVCSDITYAKSDEDPKADNQIAHYSYKVGGTEKAKTENTYDVYKRIQNKKYTVGGREFTKNIGYDNAQVATVSGNVGGTTAYEYDSMGRTSKEKDGNDYVRKSYTYDEFGQIIRENNEPLDKTFIYEYNDIGNITLVKAYDFSLSVEPEGDCTPTTYEYDTTYPDRLVSFNGNTIAYNAQGYPTLYKGKFFSWSRGKLNRIYRGSSTQVGYAHEDCTFTHNAYGQRTSKSYVYDVSLGDSGDGSYSYDTTYQYDQSGRLIREFLTERDAQDVEITRDFTYLYDECGIVGVMYSANGSTPQPYYYHRNLQGDVIAIYNTSGDKIVEYAYDAWGNCIVVYAADLGFANANPIRYRGYYFDRETGLYYLNARYYNPEWRRFISPATAGVLNANGVNGLNLYSYASNSPIGSVKLIGCANAGIVNGFNTATMLPIFKLPIINSKMGSGNFWNPHWKNQWADPDCPTLFLLSNDGFEVVSWGLSVYKGSYYFDNNENHSLYVSLGNISIFLGLVFPKDSSKDNKARLGFDASANVIEIGYDGRIIDASVSGLSIGATGLFKNGKLKFEYGYGWWGWSVSIDFIELFKLFFGGE